MTQSPVSFLRHAVSVAGCGLVLVACQTPPPQEIPALPKVGEQYLATGALTSADTPADWWQRFSDPALTALVEAGLKQNASLDAIDASIDALEATLISARLTRSPSTRSSSDATLARQPGDRRDTNATLGGSLSASWELDLSGRLKALVASAQANIIAERQARRDLAVVIASEIALSYADLRGTQVRLDVAEQNARLQKEGLDLIQTLFDNGRATQLDIERARSQYHQTLASIPVFRADIASARNRLAALVGVPASEPGEALAALEALAGIPELSGPIGAGSPAALLRRRPDVREAEALLASRLALGEAARGDLFPTVSLGATGRVLFDETSDVLRSNSLGFSLGPALIWEGPDLRRVYARIDAADARSRQAAAIYEQTVLNALAEAETALTDYAFELERRADLVTAAQSAQDSLALAGLRYREGVDDYLDVLDAQRTLLTAEDRLALNRLETARRAIRAYRSLGGIWEDPELAALRPSSEPEATGSET